MTERLRLSTDPKDPNYRLAVRYADGVWEVAQEELTSRTVGAEVTEAVSFYVTTEEVRWLLDALSKLLYSRLPNGRVRKRLDSARRRRTA